MTSPLRASVPPCLRASPPRSLRASSRRGGLLLEALVSLAIFAGAASLVLSGLRDALDALGRAERKAIAVDLAKSALARLEAGILTLADVRGGRTAPDHEQGAHDELFLVEVSTARSEFSGLSLVEVIVRDAEAVERLGPDVPPLATLRQLVDLSREEGEPRSRRDAHEAPSARGKRTWTASVGFAARLGTLVSRPAHGEVSIAETAMPRGGATSDASSRVALP